MLAALSHLPADDQRTFLTNSFGPSRPVRFPIVHHAFEHHVQIQPHAIAVEHTLFNHALTYHQLDIQANRLAHRLRAQGIRPGHRVCILARRSVYFVVAVLAVLKSGAQYVPLDAVTITDWTLDHILRDATPSAVFVMHEYAHRVSSHPAPCLCLEDLIAADERANADPTKPEDLSSPTDGVYVIYTSGTTGVPKGVDVRHNGVSNVISGSPGNVGMRPGMRVAQLLNIAFDMGAWEILSSLYNGCTLCIRGNTSREWSALMKTVDIVICTPSILARHDPADYPDLKHVIVGGEVCSQALADKWAAHTQFNNCCGPTEISVCNTVQPHTPGCPLSIGTPIPNTNLYILDRDPSSTLALPIGQVGCMWVGGVGVSKGYLNLPDKTAERWRPDPFVVNNDTDGGASMMFNTGDLGRWRPDGQIDHFGRADDQVKVKGFRVELDGVASAMRTHEPVHEAVALLVGTELWGFVTPGTVDLACVREAAAKIQPYYAVPSQYLAMQEFPMTQNGKVDKRVLGALARESAMPPAAPAETFAVVGGSAAALAHLKSPVWRLSVRNAGVPFSSSLPGTPMSIAEQPAYKWTLSGVAPPPPLPPLLSHSDTTLASPLQAVHNHTIPQMPTRTQWPLSVPTQS